MGDEVNVSPDLIWEITSKRSSSKHSIDSANAGKIGTTNSYLVKQRGGGRVQFSRDPLNLMNKHSKKVIQPWVNKNISTNGCTVYSIPVLSITK